MFLLFIIQKVHLTTCKKVDHLYNRYILPKPLIFKIKTSFRPFTTCYHLYTTFKRIVDHFLDSEIHSKPLLLLILSFINNKRNTVIYLVSLSSVVGYYQPNYIYIHIYIYTHTRTHTRTHARTNTRNPEGSCKSCKSSELHKYQIFKRFKSRTNAVQFVQFVDNFNGFKFVRISGKTDRD